MLAQTFHDAYPIDQLEEHPDNPRRGDEAAIEASMRAHGFYGVVVVQRSTRRILVGNHRTRVARRLGYDAVPVMLADVDDDQARRLLLVDNRANDTAAYDDEALTRLLADLDGVFDGTGYDSGDLRELLDRVDPSPLDLDGLAPFDRSAEHSCPFCGVRWHDTPEGPERSG
jgi:ParB-like chromosome segregation protein Spo0J